MDIHLSRRTNPKSLAGVMRAARIAGWSEARNEVELKAESLC